MYKVEHLKNVLVGVGSSLKAANTSVEDNGAMQSARLACCARFSSHLVSHAASAAAVLVERERNQNQFTSLVRSRPGSCARSACRSTVQAAFCAQIAYLLECSDDVHHALLLHDEYLKSLEETNDKMRSEMVVVKSPLQRLSQPRHLMRTATLTGGSELCRNAAPASRIVESLYVGRQLSDVAAADLSVVDRRAVQRRTARGKRAFVCFL